MELINQIITTNKKRFPARIHKGNKPEYIFVTHHGMLSNKTSWRYFEKYIMENAIVVSYDARVNGDNTLRASRFKSTYTKDLRDVVRWAKTEYPGIKVVTLGSSWGASIVIDHCKKYNEEVYKSIAWSVPYRFTEGEDAVETATTAKSKENKEVVVKETGTLGYAWRFFFMLFMNFNTKSYTKIDLTKTADNKALARINRMNKPKATPVKLFWATYKSIRSSNKSMVKINKKFKESELIYFQSTVDTYLDPSKLEELKLNSSNGLKLEILNKGKHAFQWEVENGVNKIVFNTMIKWLKTRNEYSLFFLFTFLIDIALMCSIDLCSFLGVI